MKLLVPADLAGAGLRPEGGALRRLALKKEAGTA